MIMGQVGDRAFFCPGKKNPYHQATCGDTAFLHGQKTYITIFGALGGLAFDPAYDIKQVNLSKRNKYDKYIMIWQFSYHTPYQPSTDITPRALGPRADMGYCMKIAM